MEIYPAAGRWYARCRMTTLVVPVKSLPPLRSHPRPSLPNDPRQTNEDRAARAFEVSVARTAYNYMRSYLEPLPFSADVPAGEGFSPDYEGLLVEPLRDLADNFAVVLKSKLEQELAADFTPADSFAVVKHVERAYARLRDQLDGTSVLNIGKDIDALADFAQAIAALPRATEDYVERLARLPADIEKVFETLEALPAEFVAGGATTFLRDTLYELLRSTVLGVDYLHPKSLEDYELLYARLPQPMSKVIPRETWMPPGRPFEHDWYFGWLQIAGFNTTQLARVVDLDALLEKMPLTDALLEAVVGAPSLRDAVATGNLYVVDYTMFADVECGTLHGEPRYMTAPIAVFYWNTKAPAGYPPIEKAPLGVMQPVGIQLAQTSDPKASPIFTPAGCAEARRLTGVSDPDGLKWQMAKWQVNHACAVQHETVAHLGDCHLVIEPLVVAMHRTLPNAHPIHALLTPHFRFTIAINHSALHSLVIPGGVVASVLSLDIESSMAMLRDAHLAYRFDARNPKHLFEARGVDVHSLPDYPMRDDTLLLYDAIERWVADYLAVYYPDDAALEADYELQSFIHELAAPTRVGLRGMDGLVRGGTPEEPTFRVSSREYLGQVLAQVIYTASAQHASVNYAQYPLMSYLPSVSGTAYAPVPGRDDTFTEAEFLAMLPPIDVALYQISFGYLLSSVQYDRLGYFTTNPRRPYFQDPRVHGARDLFQASLARAEAQIRTRNLTRPLAYETQVPSYVPNSISI